MHFPNPFDFLHQKVRELSRQGHEFDKHGDHINNRKVPPLFLLAPGCSYFPVSKQLDRFFLAHTNIVFSEVTKLIILVQEEKQLRLKFILIFAV